MIASKLMATPKNRQTDRQTLAYNNNNNNNKKYS